MATKGPLKLEKHWSDIILCKISRAVQECKFEMQRSDASILQDTS